MPSSDRRGSRKAERRARIVAATIALYREKGYEATSVTDIVRRAGISRRTLYGDFAAIDDIRFAVFEEVVQHFLVSAAEVLSGDDDDKLAIAVERAFRLAADQPELARAGLYELDRPEMRNRAFRARCRAFFVGAWAAQHASDHAAGRTPTSIDELTITTFVGGLLELLRHVVDHPSDAEACARTFVRTVRAQFPFRV